jgi:hypothetical protein
MNADGCRNFKLTRRRALNAGIAALAAAGPAWPFFRQAKVDPITGVVTLLPNRPTTEDPPFKTPTEPPNTPMGVGKGIHAGRVAWAHEPKVATWDGKTGNWWDDASTDPRIVDAMVSGSLRSLTGERADKEAWNALFGSFKQTRKLGGGAGYRAGEKIAIKVNSNQDRPGAWRFGAGMPSPQVLYSVVHQLITVAGVPGQDITLYDASRYIGDPIYDRIRANPDRNFQAVKFAVSQRMAGNGRTEALPDKANPVEFCHPAVPTAYLPQCVTEAKYLVNVALSRAHGLMGVTQTAKNLFGSVYFEGPGFTPQPLHDFASRDLPMGAYNCLVDLMAHNHLGGKTLLYLSDFLYVAVSQNERVIKYQSFDDHWCSSLFASEDPVAIDSVGLDFIRNEPRALECRGKPENYLHEAALAEKPPSGTVYDPDRDHAPVTSLGVHEHWNNANDKQYSRNLGKREGIELVRA